MSITMAELRRGVQVSPGVTIRMVSVRDLLGDPVNANRGTPEGRELLRKSIGRLGPGRSVLLDANNTLIAGNKTWEVYGEEGGENVLVVETDGQSLLAHKRSDLKLGDQRRDEMAFADNWVGLKSLDFDTEVLLAMQENGVDLTEYMKPVELADMVKRDQEALAQLAKEQDQEGIGTVEHDRYPLAVVLSASEYRRWSHVKESRGMDDKALLLAFLAQYEKDTGSPL